MVRIDFDLDMALASYLAPSLAWTKPCRRRRTDCRTDNRRLLSYRYQQCFNGSTRLTKSRWHQLDFQHLDWCPSRGRSYCRVAMERCCWRRVGVSSHPCSPRSSGFVCHPACWSRRMVGRVDLEEPSGTSSGRSRLLFHNIPLAAPFVVATDPSIRTRRCD